MDWIQYAGTAVLSGGTAFLAAWGRFKQKLQEHDTALARQAADVATFREQYTREKDHKRELEDLRDKERASRPDPFEDIRHDIARLEEDVEKLKDKVSNHVHANTFAAFTKSQEDQWRDMMRTLGKLEGLFK